MFLGTVRLSCFFSAVHKLYSVAFAIISAFFFFLLVWESLLRRNEKNTKITSRGFVTAGCGKKWSVTHLGTCLSLSQPATARWERMVALILQFAALNLHFNWSFVSHEKFISFRRCRWSVEASPAFVLWIRSLPIIYFLVKLAFKGLQLYVSQVIRIIFADSYNLSRSRHGKVLEHVHCCRVRVSSRFQPFPFGCLRW